jgi:hypothetical protein
MLDEYAAHGLGRGGEKISPVGRFRDHAILDQSLHRLVQQVGRLQGMSRPFVPHVPGREAANLRVDGVAEISRRIRIAWHGAHPRKTLGKKIRIGVAILACTGEDGNMAVQELDMPLA